MLRAIKYRLRSYLPPAIFLAISGYFGWNAMHGKSGLEAQNVQIAELAQAQQAFSAADAERQQWEVRIADLSGRSISQDMLDGQARKVLNLANPNDLVIDLPQNKSAE